MLAIAARVDAGLPARARLDEIIAIPAVIARCTTGAVQIHLQCEVKQLAIARLPATEIRDRRPSAETPG